MPAPSLLSSGGDVLNGCERRALAYRDIECDDAANRGQGLAEVIGVSAHGDLKTVAVEAQHCLAEVTSNQSGAHAGASALGQVGRHSVGDGDRVAVQGQRRGATTNSLQIGVVEESTISGGRTTSAEFLQAAWWNPQRMWLAEREDRLVGSATLALRGSADRSKAVIHWMMVHPEWRRQGVGRLLATRLEAAAWDLGHREIFLETHASWQAAVAFYQRLGYRSD